jgi:23S rRNA (cytidine1920-2'-O)/16S rRNA (cytidine1409-2'-O)-methyltransferase
LVRIDSELAARGLARSRSHAANLVDTGRVLVDGKPARKASQNVAEDAKLKVIEAVDYVSRAGHKLAGALDEFGALDLVGKVALDVGASTGGFTDVCLRRGARHVIALDVGHDQIAEEFRGNPRVSVIEGFNARELSTETLSAALGTDSIPEIEIVVADLSFISLTLVLEQVFSVAPKADYVLLVKPQFEAGKESLNAHGIVTDHRLRSAAVEGVAEFGEKLGLRIVDVLRSSLPGTHGNIEYVLWMSATQGEYLSKWKQRIAELAKESK